MDRTTISFTGRLAGDPEIRFTQAGTPVANFRVAVNRRVRTESGEWEDAAPTWWDVSAARDLAVNVEASLRKGHPVLVIGTVVTDIWTDSRNERRESKKVLAEKVAVPLDRHQVGQISKPEPTRSNDDRDQADDSSASMEAEPAADTSAEVDGK